MNGWLLVCLIAMFVFCFFQWRLFRWLRENHTDEHAAFAGLTAGQLLFGWRGPGSPQWKYGMYVLRADFRSLGDPMVSRLGWTAWGAAMFALCALVLGIVVG